MDYNPNDKNQERYVDSPVFVDIAMSLFAIMLGFGTYASIRQPSPNLFVVAIFGFFTVVCVVGVLSQKRRTFVFDKSSQTLTWTSRGLRENASGTAPFYDVTVSLDASTLNEGHESYRLMIATSEGTMPLTNSYDLRLEDAQKRVAHLREVLGKSESL